MNKKEKYSHIYSDTIFMRLGLLVFVASIASGCISLHPVDVSFVSVRAVDYKHQKELPPPNNSSTESTNNNTVLRKVPVGRMNYDSNLKPHRLMLKVEFQSNDNLSHIITKKNYPLGGEAFYCDGPGLQVLKGDYSVYWNGVNLSYVDNGLVGLDEATRPVTYYLFLNARGSLKGASDFARFNLIKNPKDICFRLEGGSAGIGYRSKNVIIPKEKIRQALAEWNRSGGFNM